MKKQSLHVDVADKNLDLAVEQALAELGCTRAEADVEVLQVHSSGFLGLFGKRPAKVRVRLHDRGVIARQITNRLLILSGLQADIKIVTCSERVDLLLVSDEPSRLIGRHGQTLDALQTLVGTMTDRLTTDRTPLQIDVDGYRERRHEFLSRLAQRMIRKVRQTGKPASTPPLILNERRVLHELFKQETDLESSSKNHEGGRKTILLKRRAS